MDKRNARNYFTGGCYTPAGFLDEARKRFYRRDPDTNELQHCAADVRPEPERGSNDWFGPANNRRWRPNGSWEVTPDEMPHPFRTRPEEDLIQAKE